MGLLAIIFLLVFFHTELAISASSPIFGPKQVTGLLGGSVTVKCFYPRTSVNRHSRKYWCKESTRQCSTIISSNGFVALDYQGRASITDFPENGIFIIEIAGLKRRDMGPYKCGIGFNDRGLSFRVKLDVSEGSIVPEEAQLFYVEQQGSVTMTCAFGNQYTNANMYLCKMTKTSCSTIIDTQGNIDPSFKGRVLLSKLPIPGSFSITMTQLKKQDSGLYLCGAGTYGAEGESKKLDVHVFEEALVPKIQPVLNGVRGGSVSVECHYNPKENVTVKYWCKWKQYECIQIISNSGHVQDSYEGRIVMHDNPENGTYTILLNQLNDEDAGYYWCMTNGEQERKSSTELNIVEGKPNLAVDNGVQVVAGSPLTVSCSYPCKYANYEKYWCKWKNTGCDPIVSIERDPSGFTVNCNKGNRVLTLNFDQISLADQGWYWCGIRHASHYGETHAIYLQVQGVLQNSGDVRNPSEESNDGTDVPQIKPENRGVPLNEPKEAAGVGGSADSHGDSKSSTVLLSVLIPVGVIFLLLVTMFVVVKYRFFKHSDLVSVGSYRTNISMTDFENARQYGAKDNICMEGAHETQIGGTNDCVIMTGSPKEEGKSRKKKRGSKEEVEMAYTTFLLNSENLEFARNSQEQNSGSC
ncbi:polymeric immunoglobulin receptor [Pogona vitticeps]